MTTPTPNPNAYPLVDCSVEQSEAVRTDLADVTARAALIARLTAHDRYGDGLAVILDQAVVLEQPTNSKPAVGLVTLGAAVHFRLLEVAGTLDMPVDERAYLQRLGSIESLTNPTAFASYMLRASKALGTQLGETAPRFPNTLKLLRHAHESVNSYRWKSLQLLPQTVGAAAVMRWLMVGDTPGTSPS